MAKQRRLLDQILESNSSPTDITVFIAHLIKDFGDAEGLAREVFREYQAADTGTQIRGRLLLGVVEMLKDYGVVHDPTADVPDDLLEPAVIEMLLSNEEALEQMLENPAVAQKIQRAIQSES